MKEKVPVIWRDRQLQNSTGRAGRGLSSAALGAKRKGPPGQVGLSHLDCSWDLKGEAGRENRCGKVCAQGIRALQVAECGRSI